MWVDWWLKAFLGQNSKIDQCKTKQKTNKQQTVVLPITSKIYIPNFVRATRDVLTANDNSIGSSGGTTDVRINVHSRNSLYLFLFGSSLPEKWMKALITHNKNAVCFLITPPNEPRLHNECISIMYHFHKTMKKTQF